MAIGCIASRHARDAHARIQHLAMLVHQEPCGVFGRVLRRWLAHADLDKFP
jgi:hypothetical protein